MNPRESELTPSGRGLLKNLGIVVPVVTAIAVAVPLLANWGERSSNTDTLVQVTHSSTPPSNTPSLSKRGEPSPSKPGETNEESPSAAGGAPDNEGVDPSMDSSSPDAEVAIGNAEAPRLDPDNWLVPVSAPFSSFPVNGMEEEGGCTAEQFSWLKTNAFPRQDSQFIDVTLQNTASSGAALSLGSIRFEGEEIPSEAWVFFECPHGGKGDGGGSQPIVVDAQGTPAIWGEAIFGDNPEPVGSPVTLNLSPGEVAQVAFALADAVDAQRAYRGRFVADVVGSDTPVVVAGDIDFVRAQLPGYYLGWGASYSTLHCGTPDPDGADEYGYVYSDDVPCTVEEAAHLLSVLAEEFSGA